MVSIKGWAFKENQDELAKERFGRYQEIKDDPGITVESVRSAYAETLYNGTIENPERTALDILLICDRGNTCFGGAVAIEKGRFSATVFTD